MNRLSANLRRVAVFAGILILILMVMDFNTRLEELDRLKKQDSVVQIQATQAMQTQVGLQTQIAYADSDQAVQDWARGEGHYVQPGDQAVIPVGPSNSTPAQTPASTVSPTPMPNWQIWWNLFFGNQ